MALVLAVTVAVILAVVCGVLLAYLSGLRRGMAQAGRGIRERMEDGANSRLPMPCPDRAAEDLLEAVNELLELRQSERTAYREKEQALRRQIANVSHDLRTPLTSILGYLQLLEREDLPEKTRREYLAVIEGRARTLQTFINSFYDLSRMEGGEWKLEREKVDLARELSDQLAAAYQQLEEAGLAVEVEIADGLPPVWADRSGVVRVFSNLLTNALRHGTGPLTIRLHREGEQIVSRFSNRAEDMTAEDAAHVFERFYTADQMRTGQDTGLGLAIVDALTRRMGHTACAFWAEGVFTVEVRWNL